jgi:hypothetical protein
MTRVLLAAGLFVIGLAVHLGTWRVRRPKRPFLALVLIFGSLLVVVVGSAGLWRQWVGLGGWDLVQLSVFHLSMSLAYIVTYTALEGSPSVALVTFIAAAGAEGRELFELYGAIGDDQILGNRFQSLVDNGLLRANARGAYYLTRKGRFWAEVFAFCRKVFCLKIGG